MYDDNSPWEALRNRRIPEEMAETMEGDLTLEELNEALFMHMNGNSSTGIDSFTVNYLRTFWQQMKYLIKDALNLIQKDDLTHTLISVILKLLRKG